MKSVMLSWFKMDSVLPGYKPTINKPSSPNKAQLKTLPPNKTSPKHLMTERHYQQAPLKSSVQPEHF
jgi:hypothetical protein